MERDYLNKVVHTRTGETLTITGFTLGDLPSEDVITLSNGKSYQVGVGVGNGFLRIEDEGLMDQLHQEQKEKEEYERKIEEERIKDLEIRKELRRIEEQRTSDSITEFRGDYRFLSNFYQADVTYNGITYHNNECAFQAQKDPRVANEFADLTNPVAAKQKGRKVRLRPDWEKVKVGIMEEINRSKFTQHPELKQKLLDTGDRFLMEGVRDNFWGGTRNELGKILMKIRKEFRDEEQ